MNFKTITVSILRHGHANMMTCHSMESYPEWLIPVDEDAMTWKRFRVAGPL